MKKGFTLVETVISITLLLIIFAIAFPVITSNLRSMYDTEKKNDLQREAYKVMKLITDKFSETYQLADLRNDASGNLESITLIAYEYTDEKRYTYNFELQGTDLYFKKVDADTDAADVPGSVVAHDIEKMEILPKDNSSNEVSSELSNCTNVAIEISFNKDYVKYFIGSKVKFRNQDEMSD